MKHLSLAIKALHLIKLMNCTSAVTRSSAADTLLHTDPLLAVVRMYGKLNNLLITPAISVMPYDDLSSTVAEHAKNHMSDMIMLPWLPPPPSTMLKVAVVVALVAISLGG
jgi:hypothetical protein